MRICTIDVSAISSRLAGRDSLCGFSYQMLAANRKLESDLQFLRINLQKKPHQYAIK